MVKEKLGLNQGGTYACVKIVSIMIVCACDLYSCDIEMYQVLVANYDERQKVSTVC